MNEKEMSVKMQKIMARMKQRREFLGMSYQDLAKKTGMSKSTLQRYETGNIRNMPIDKFEDIAEALMVSPSYLMGWNNEEPISVLKKRINVAFEQLNDLGQTEAVKRVEELTEIQRYTASTDSDDSSLLAAHPRDGVMSDKLYSSDISIMTDDDF